MKVIELEEEAIPLIKSTLSVKINLLQSKLKHYREELKLFEKKYKMSSQAFCQKFNEGLLGDDKAWFKWIYLYETLTVLQKDLKLIKDVRL